MASGVYLLHGTQFTSKTLSWNINDSMEIMYYYIGLLKVIGRENICKHLHSARLRI